MDCFFLSFEWYKGCNWTKNFFSEMKKDVNNFEVSDSCSILDHLLAHESRIYALQGQIEIAKVGRPPPPLHQAVHPIKIRASQIKEEGFNTS
jgi:hypothetical protein